jgi:asparagine synthase (glutamine-hydrolysing)
MISDVPLGAFLSGGVDSSAVVASMALVSSEPVRTFTVGFEAASGIDERRYAHMVAERYGTRHTEYVISPDVDAITHSLAWFYGEPYADEVTIPTYCISAIARRDVTVALNGDGGDEAFLGYRRHAASRMGARVDHIPLALRRLVSTLGRNPRLLQNHNRSVRNVGKALAGAAQTPVERYTDWVTYGTDDLLNVLATPDMRDHLYRDAVARFAPYFAGDIRPEDAASRADMQALLNENLEVRVDIATMANGLEGRSPFLDHKFIEWAAAIPPQQRMRGMELKSLLKKALLPRVPKEVMYRPKQGFFMDFGFLTEREAMIRDVVLAPAATGRGLLDPARVRRLLDQHYHGGNRHNAEVFMLFILEQWFQMWIDPPAIPTSPPPAPRIDG